MDTEKRRRGRPPGEGKNDNQRLRRVADLRVRNQTLTPTAAIKIVYREGSDSRCTELSFVRRLQRKWAASGPEHMEAARRQHEYETRQATQAIHHNVPEFVVSIHEAIVAFQGSPFLRDLNEAIRVFRETINSPDFQQRMREANKALEAFQGSPVARLLDTQPANIWPSGGFGN
ncbi:hypothetical protein ACE103_42850 [Bradyrhizobium sp. ma5]|uniref:hypothetical protein n=1 Tax=Bradyrhizobium sp. ma5 TaxID=3344828 RepID=UPI0035D51C1B